MIKPPKLDRIDINILAELQKSGRMTNAQLADRVGLSASPCLARVKRLEDGGYITGYGAFINLAKLASVQIVFTSMTLSDHRLPDFMKFEQGIQDFEEIVECHLVSGGFDYLLKFYVRSVTHYQEVIEKILERNIGVAKYFSYIVIKSPLARNHAPVKMLSRG
ncbi:Lrp/AsnC family transcriptional regulator [Phenylobacterium sp.]|uniref:Lrp/AsnC family transcriptional regulator n=1 Tax=Phenylobacterium sp. TaxID=1871053 RepID=UPI0035B1ACBE